MWKILHMSTLKFVTLAGSHFTGESRQEIQKVINKYKFILWGNQICFKVPGLSHPYYPKHVIELQSCEFEPFYERKKC